MELTYFNIQRFCLRDGPGIRTTLFLKGCPLRCRWCHNPEGQAFRKELMFRQERCVGCGRCIGLCSARSLSDGKALTDRALCTACGKCVELCLADCNEICGATADTDDVFAQLMRDKIYFEDSGGGITVSGGEPLAQAGATLELARLARDENVSFAVETSGHADSSSLLELASLGALFLYDIKGVDDKKHIENTGVSNGTVLSNLDALVTAGADVILRLPLIPGMNDSERDLELLSNLISEYRDGIIRAEIMPYHRIGLGKTSSLGRAADDIAEIPDGKQFADGWREALSGCGVKIIVN